MLRVTTPITEGKTIMSKEALVTAEFLYSGFPDFWGGNGDRWDDDKGCLFAGYGKGTTVRDIVQDAVNDFLTGGDCDSLPEEVNCETIREALLACLSDAGRKDYASGVVSEFATEYAEVNGLNRCRGCDAHVGESHKAGCDYWLQGVVEYNDCNKDECRDSPMIVFLIRTEVCDECGALADYYIDDICEACAIKHGFAE